MGRDVFLDQRTQRRRDVMSLEGTRLAIAEPGEVAAQVELEIGRNVVGEPGMNGPGEVPCDVVGRPMVTAGVLVRVTKARQVNARGADSGTDIGHETAMRAEIPVGIRQEKPIVLHAPLVVRRGSGVVPVRPAKRCLAAIFAGAVEPEPFGMLPADTEPDERRAVLTIVKLPASMMLLDRTSASCWCRPTEPFR